MDHTQRSLRNLFTTGWLDRLSDKRRDDVWLTTRLEDDTTRFIPVWRLENLFTDGQEIEPVFLSPRDVRACIPAAESTILLGEIDNKAYFALGLPPEDCTPPTYLTDLGQFQDLRRLATLLDEQDAALMAYARAMTYWHNRHRFCGVCGSPTDSIEGGFQRLCVNVACGHRHFPRTDPAIIVLVTSGERGLLGRQPSWPEGMVSTLAGFVEPGETLEDAVIREVREETSIELCEVHYHSSQPWPFPSSLMLGFSAQAASAEIRVDEYELENACWFTREELERKLKSDVLRLPSPMSISFRLIEDWFDAGSCGPLRGIV
jgi:NAD+ diphosphatase